jgi:hypothetical protein
MAAHAAKKRRPEEEEAEEEVHLAFRGAANALSQVYAHAVAHQKASFVAGERRAMVRSLPFPLTVRFSERFPFPLRSAARVARKLRSWREFLAVGLVSDYILRGG